MGVLVGGWALAVAALFIAIVRPWRPSHAWPLVPLMAGIIAAGWALWSGARQYADLIAQHSWTAATIVIPYAPVKALIFVILAYFSVRSLLSLRIIAKRQAQDYAAPALLSAITIFVLASDIMAGIAAARVRAARDPNLSPAQVNTEIARINHGMASRDEVLAFLENPLCPATLLELYAQDDVLFKTQVARNPKVPVDIVLRLSKDENATVRYYASHSNNLPQDELPRLAADTDPLVRESVAWKDKLPDEDFARLINDSAPRVRAAAALQRRIGDDDLLRLTTDPEESVRASATRMAVQRGLQ